MECGKLDVEGLYQFDEWTKDHSILPNDAWKDIFGDNPKMHSYIGALREVGRLMQTVGYGMIPEEVLLDFKKVLEYRKSQEPSAGFDRGHQVVWDAWIGVGAALYMRAAETMDAQVPEFRKAQREIPQVTAEEIDPHFPHQKSEYNFWKGVLKLLAKFCLWGKDVPVQFDNWAQNYSQLPDDEWKKIFPEYQRARSYNDVVLEVARLLQHVYHEDIKDSLLENFNDLLKERRLQQPGTGHLVDWRTWLGVGTILEEVVGGRRMVAKVPEFPRRRETREHGRRTFQRLLLPASERRVCKMIIKLVTRFTALDPNLPDEFDRWAKNLSRCPRDEWKRIFAEFAEDKSSFGEVMEELAGMLYELGHEVIPFMLFTDFNDLLVERKSRKPADGVTPLVPWDTWLEVGSQIEMTAIFLVPKGVPEFAPYSFYLSPAEV